jgi:hypothetical protein
VPLADGRKPPKPGNGPCKINPVNEEYWQELAETHYKSGEFKQAIPAFEKVLDPGGYCCTTSTHIGICRKPFC